MGKDFHSTKNAAKIPETLIKEYLETCTRKKANKKQMLFGPNEAPDYIYMVTKGKVRVYISYPDGREFTIVILDKGGVYSGHARGFGVALTANTEIALIHVRQFQKMMETHKDFMMSILAVLGDALKNTVNIIENLAFREVEERLLHYLQQLADKYGIPHEEEKDKVIIDLPLTQEEIATAIGSSRQTVSSLLKQLERDEIIAFSKKNIIIKQKMSDS